MNISDYFRNNLFPIKLIFALKDPHLLSNMPLDSQSKPKQFFQDFLLAGTISAFSRFLIEPIAKFRTYGLFRNEDGTSYLSRKIKEQGLSVMWRDSRTNFKRYSTYHGLLFAFYDLFKNTFCSSFDGKTEFWRFLMSHMTAGAAAGSLAMFMVYPDLSKLREKRTGFPKDGGVFRLYKGFLPLAVEVMIYRSIYFGGYETAKKVTFPQWTEKSFVGKYLVALGVTIFAVLLSNPVGTLRRRTSLKIEDFQYKAALNRAKQIYKEEGWKAFFKGGHLSWISGISAALNLVLYDELKALLFEESKM